MRLRPLPLVLGLTCLALALMRVSSASADQSTDASLMAKGRELYVTGCSSCHGDDGAGVRIRSAGDGLGNEIIDTAAGTGELRGPSLKTAGAAGAYYYLSTGRMPLANPGDQPRRKEPAYTTDEIDALVAYVASLGDGPALPRVDLSDADVANGGVVFRHNCQACHSAFGSGGALSYGRAAPNLRSTEPREVGAAIRTGPGQMPVFGDDVIDGADLNDLASYIEYLRTPQDPGGLPIGRNGPVPEGFVAWLFGIGGLLLVVAWIGGRAPIRAADEDDGGTRP